jgi:hypothetical protein
MKFLKDLLFTDMFLIKGHANTGGQRLSTFLNRIPKRFLEMEETTLIKHDGSGRFFAPCVQVRVSDIIFAHEMEVTGDESLRFLAEHERDDIEVNAYFSGITPLQLSGKVRKRALAPDALNGNDFIVMIEPRLEGFTPGPAPEYTIFENLPYAIVNKNRLAFIFPKH